MAEENYSSPPNSSNVGTLAGISTPIQSDNTQGCTECVGVFTCRRKHHSENKSSLE